MKTHHVMRLLKCGLALALLSVFVLPLLAGAAAPVAQVPTGPKDINNNWATPDYYTTANWANSPPLAKFVDTLPGLTAANANSMGQYLTVANPDIVTYPGSDYYEIDLIEYRQKLHPDLPATKGTDTGIRNTTGTTEGTLLRGYVQVNNGTNTANCGPLPKDHECGPADNTLAPEPVHFLGPNIVAFRDRPVRIKFRNRLPAGELGDLFIPVDTSVMGAGKGPAKHAATPVRGVGVPCNNTDPQTEPTCASYTQNRSDIHLHGGRTPWISDGTPHQWITPVEELTPFAKGVSFYNVPDMPDPGDGATTYYWSNQQSARLMFYHEHAWGITRLNPYAGIAAGYVLTDQWEQDLIGRGILPPFLDQIPLVIQDRTFVDATPATKYIYNPASGLYDTPVSVPKVRETDPLWNWGSSVPDVDGIRQPVTGDLWTPHVYMPAQTQVAGGGGVNPFGRWMYGPWFYPATVVEKGPVANPYYDPNCSSPNPFVLAECQTPGQPTQIPGTPHPSMGMEAFQDSVMVNGAVFPTLTVDPRTYRFRVLNAANDRFWNLNFYKADPAQISSAKYFNPQDPAFRPGLSPLTEVKMVPASLQLATQNNWPADWPVDGRAGGVPDPGVCQPGGINCSNFGPTFLQIGTEGGFLPKPVEIKHQPIVWLTDPTAFWFGTVDKMGLALGPAERADVLVDFSQYAGQTLILYNDAPAAWPAGVPNYDYYTGAPDMRDTGGYGTGGTWDSVTGTWVGGTGPLVGFAPNTRTVMQVIVRDTAAGTPYVFDRARMEAEFTAAAEPTAINPSPVKTLFERSQEPIIVGQAAYAEAYPNSYFPTNFPWEGINQINDHFLNFVTLAGEQVHAITEPKGLHDEMGASFDPIYGRMSGNLGMQLPNPTNLTALLILYGYSDLPSEVVNNSTQLNVQVLPGLPGQAGTLTDGTQIWKISHNGVDTHPIHFHIFDVQLINRVGWDGQIKYPEPNELGWKDTIKISPLMDTIVAVRPKAPALPFGLPNSIRPLNPGIPIDSAMGFGATPSPGSTWPIANVGSGFNSVDWTTGAAFVGTAVPPYPYPNYKGVVTNVLYDFGWEYVWHCHILSHEEMDMMRTIVLNYESMLPPAFVASSSVSGSDVVLTWNDPTPVDYTDPGTFGNPANEVGFNVYKTTGGVLSKLNTAPLLANSTTYTHVNGTAGDTYIVEAFNNKGNRLSYVGSLAPDAVLTAPGNPFTVPAPVVLETTVSNLPGSVGIAKVEYFEGSVLIGAAPVLTPPYQFTWAGAAVTPHVITAKVTTTLGEVIISNPVTVTVLGALTADFTPAGGTVFNICDTITFADASGGNPTTWNWLINGITYTSSTVALTLPQGTYPIRLTVGDGLGASATTTKTISVTGNHAPVASHGGFYTISGGTLQLNGTATDADLCDTLTYGWDVDGKAGFEFTTANPSISFAALKKVLGIGTFTITFKATDRSGASSTATTTVTVLEGTAPPTGVTAVLENIENIRVSWTASLTPTATYTLRAIPTTGVPTTISGIAGTSMLLTGLPDGTYTISVQADVAGMPSSAAVTAGSVLTISRVAVAPSWVGAQLANEGKNITVWWPLSTTPGATYSVFVNGTLHQSGIAGTSIILTGLPNGTYSIAVRADRNGWASSGLVTAAAQVTISKTVKAPEFVGAQLYNGGVDIKVWWGVSETPGATYTVFANGSQLQTGIAGASVILTGLANGTYTITVRADLNGWVSSTPKAAAGGAVTINKTAPATAWLGVQKYGANGIKLWWPTSSLAGAGYSITETYNGVVNPTPITGPFATSGSLKVIVLSGKPAGTYSYTIRTTAAGYNNSSPTNGSASVTITP